MSTSAFFQGAHNPVVNGGTLHSANQISINNYYACQPGQHAPPQPIAEGHAESAAREEPRLDNFSENDKILYSLEEKHMRTEDLLVTLTKLVQEIQSTTRSPEPIPLAASTSERVPRSEEVSERTQRLFPEREGNLSSHVVTGKEFSSEYVINREKRSIFRFRQSPFKRFSKTGPGGSNSGSGSEKGSDKKSGPKYCGKPAELSDLSSMVIAKDELSNNDAIIAVMGSTGTGKSSFINMACGLGSNSVAAGHSLESCTSEISLVRLQSVELPYNIVFVDTPGFDDTTRSDVDILEMISTWLATTYKQQIYLTGILYLHRITDNRMAGSPLKTFRVFEELCGRKMFHKIIIITTMWDEIEEAVGGERERCLKELYWNRMVAKGTTTRRYRNNHASALEIIQPLVDLIGQSQAVLLQEEMVDMRMRLRDTSAGCALYSKLEDLVGRQQELLKRIRIESHTGDEIALQSVLGEYNKLKEKLKETIKEMQAIKPSLGKRLYQYLTFETKRKTYV